MIIGPTFGAELIAAGCQDGVSWDSNGILVGASLPGVAAVLAAHDPTKVLVPQSVTALQGRLQLFRSGLLTTAETAINAQGGEVLIWYSNALTWYRTDPHILAIAQALSLTSAQVDTLFIEGSVINGNQ